MSEGVAREVWTTLHQPQEDVLGRKLSISSVIPHIVGGTYMEVDTNGDEKTWKSKTITDPLHQSTSGPESRGSDINTAVPVNDGSNGDVDSCNDEMAEPDDPKTESLIPHLGNDGEADSQLMSYEGSCTCDSLCGCTSVCKDQSRNGG